MEAVAEQDIPGWYAFRPFYEGAVADSPPGATLVEVGVFCGRSLADLARMARASGKGLRVVGVDTFRGSPEFAGMVMWHGRPFDEAPPGALVFECFSQLHHAGLLDDVALLVSDSVRAAGLFADGSVHAVMLDGAHDEASVAADIDAWWPKVAPGGVLAGDDLDVPGFEGIRAAVASRFPAFDSDGATWIVRKEGP
jgi:hypothetical protein